MNEEDTYGQPFVPCFGERGNTFYVKCFCIFQCLIIVCRINFNPIVCLVYHDVSDLSVIIRCLISAYGIGQLLTLTTK